MNYGKIIYYDTANARGLSTVLFVSGCTNKCDGCHNKETWDFNYGQPFTDKEKNEIIKSLKNPYIKNFVISGGDPCHLRNIIEIINLCKEIREQRIDINIIVYTGYEIDSLWNRIGYTELFELIDYLIDGKYDKLLPVKSLDYRGSTNQKCWTFKIEEGKRQKIDVSKYYFKNK